MSKKNKKPIIGIAHVDIISFIALIVGICSIVNAILEKTPSAVVILIFGIPLTISSAINLIVSIHVMIVHSIIQNQEIPKGYFTKSITSKEEIFKYTVILLILTIVVLMAIIL
ncbi:MAG: hypothetical protein IKT41_04675 [Clostridia bacterium]|nr:hypothetical protein [Clostridia bacterium]